MACCERNTLLGLTIIGGGIAAIIGGPAWSNFQELLHMVLPTETILLGGVTGFYLGSSKK